MGIGTCEPPCFKSLIFPLYSQTKYCLYIVSKYRRRQLCSHKIFNNKYFNTKPLLSVQLLNKHTNLYSFLRFFTSRWTSLWEYFTFKRSLVLQLLYCLLTNMYVNKGCRVLITDTLACSMYYSLYNGVLYCQHCINVWYHKNKHKQVSCSEVHI